MAYRDEDSILDQIYEKQILSAFYYEDLKENAYLKKYSTQQQGTHKIGFYCNPMLVCIFAYSYEN